MNHQALYNIVFKLKEFDNVIFLRKVPFDSKIVETRIMCNHPLKKEILELVFAGASTRRQRLYKYKEVIKNGQILGG